MDKDAERAKWRVVPAERGIMALERCADFSEGSERPRNTNYFSVNRMALGDMKVCIQDRSREARVLLDRMLCGPKAALGLEELRRIRGLDLFEYVEPIVGFGGGSQGHKDLWEHTKKVVEQAVPKSAVRWAALFHDVGKPRTIARHEGKIGFHGHEVLGSKMFKNFFQGNMLFSGEEGKRIHDIILFLGRVESFEGEWTDSAVRRLMNDLGDRLEDVMSLSSADITTGRDSKRQAILESIAALGVRIAAVRAEESMPRLPKGLGDVLCEKLGVPKSRELGTVMKDLESRLRSGSIPRDTGLDGYVEIVRKERG
jgi:poly(A) polymerase